MSAQIQKGETFTDVSPGKSVTSTRLNNHVDSAIILPGAITEQTDIATGIASDDLLLMSDTSASSALKKVQAQNVLPVGVITSKTDLAAAIATDDYLLVYDTSAAALKKVAASAILPPEAITGKTDIAAAVAAGDLLLMADVSASNALMKIQAQNLLPLEVITSKTALTAVAGNDLALVSDTSASGALRKVALADLTPTFTSSAVALNGLGAGKPIDVAHGLVDNAGAAVVPRFVRAVLVCTTANLNYSIGDEVDALSAIDGGTNPPSVNAGASTTNVWVCQSVASASLQIKNKTTGVFAAITPSSWSVKVYASL